MSSNNKVSEKDSQDFPVVGIGASAGGLEATRRLLENLPEQSGLAFVVIQHLAETPASLLPEILSRATKVTVTKVENGEKIKLNHVYVIPAASVLTITNGVFELKPKSGFHKPIDEFLISLALERKNKAIGIVLSGTGDDGTEGLRAIKVEGGITFAQDPKTAQYPDMPQSAISSENSDFVLSPEQIAHELVEIVKHPGLVSRRKKEMAIAGENEPDLQKIFAVLRGKFGVNFTHYKKNTIERRITRRMVLRKTDTLEEYKKYLQTHPEEIQALFDDLLIGVTEFFREPKTFDLLKEAVFPELITSHSKGQPIRVWVPGCSTGEEVYSIAIALQEFFDNQNIVEYPIQIFGTDINEKNIEKARKGIYPKIINQRVSERLLAKFFTSSNGNYQVAKRTRDLCVFARHDITHDPPFSGMDLVMCRNVLIYFDTILQERVIPLFNYGLKKNGFLVLGESETVGKFTGLFEPLIKKSTIFRKKEQVKIELPIETAEGFMIHKQAVKAIAKTDTDSLVKEQVDNLLFEEYVPATFVVNDSLAVVFVRGQVYPYIIMEQGAPSFSIVKVLRKEFRPAVQTSIYRAKKENKTVTDIVQFESGDLRKTVRVQVKPLVLPKTGSILFIVTLAEAKVSAAPVKIEKGVSESALTEQVKDLSEALESTKQTLQNSVEQQEATNEELRSAMEELQSSNEELQSTNEELETAKEELQSSNEELSTVNSELKERNDSLTQVNDDLVNLLNKIDTAIIIVDRELRVRRFTNPAQEFLRLIPTDVGRKITDIRLNISVENFEKELLSAINSLKVIKTEIKADPGSWYHLRIRPYVSEEKKIEGAVITIVDITDIKKAQESLGFQADLLANVQDAVIAVDKNFIIIYWSNCAEDLLGWTAKEAIGQPSGKILAVKMDGISRKQGIEKLLIAGFAKGEASYRRKDGTYVVTDVSSTVLRDKQGNLKGIVNSLRDISERKQVEEALQKSEYLYRTLFENTEDGFQLLQPLYDEAGNPCNLVLLKVNKAYERQTDLKAVDVVGKTVKEYIPDIEPYWISAYGNVAKTGKSVHIENYNRSTNRWYDVYAFPYSEGQVGALFKDITRRKKTEQALKESEGRFRMVVENSLDGINLLDLRSGKYVFMSPAQVKLTGFTAEELNNFTVQEAYERTHPDDRQKTINQQKRVAAGEDLAEQVEYRWKVKTGEYRWFSDRRKVVRDEKGQAIALVGISRDITERKNLEKQLQDKERLSAIGATAGMVGHDIRNPLQSIVSDTFLVKNELKNMAEGQLKSDIEESIVNIEDQAVYIDKIVKDLQDFAKQVKPECVKADIKAVIEDALSNIRVPKNIEVIVSVKSSVVKLELDTTLFRRILTNLIINAIQAMPNGGKLTLEVCQKGDKALISVIDTGVGIPDEVKARLFTPMVTTKAKGQGFGLAVVKRFVEAQGGTISFISQAGKGTEFIIEYPLPK